MTRKVAVVTGANKGIGLAIVKKLCVEFPGIVYLTSRDVARGQDAVNLLKKEGLNPEYHQLDIDNMESILKFRDYIRDVHGGLDCLVNNAAIAFKVASTEPFENQAEETIRVNYFGTLNNCNILFPLLRPHARVVNVSSSAGFLGRIPSGDLKNQFSSSKLTIEQLSNLMKAFVIAAKENTMEKEGWPNSCYSVSKVGVSALTRIQQKEFERGPIKDIVINHVHPGYVDTDMTSHKGPLTIEQGAVAPTYAALLPPGIEKPRGDYIWYDKQIVDWVNGPLPSKY